MPGRNRCKFPSGDRQPSGNQTCTCPLRSTCTAVATPASGYRSSTGNRCTARQKICVRRL